MSEAVSHEDFKRLEGKVDKLADAIQRLILIEERQTTQGERIGKCEATLQVHDAGLQRIDSKVERWVNRGIGVWAVAVVVFAMFEMGTKLLR